MTDLKKYKVLVIDDEILIREVVKAALQHFDFEAVTLESPSLADTVIRKTKPDLIVMDLYMPELNGLQLLRKLKADPELEKIPVIIFTGSGERVDVLSGQQAGVYEYITKPVDHNVLIARIRKLLRLKERQGDA
ncbi:MAG: response regulator [Elusimicrobia bacterium]|nr:response regulator [Elusimicrobiota bacterium]